MFGCGLAARRFVLVLWDLALEHMFRPGDRAGGTYGLLASGTGKRMTCFGIKLFDFTIVYQGVMCVGSCHMQELTDFQWVLLWEVARQQARGEKRIYGLSIKRGVESYYDTEINHGRLYPNLDELAGDGLIEKEELDKRTNSISLSPEGIALLNERRGWEDEGSAVLEW